MRLIVAAVLVYIGIMQFVVLAQGGSAVISIVFGLVFIGVGVWFAFYAIRSYRQEKADKGSEDSSEGIDREEKD